MSADGTRAIYSASVPGFNIYLNYIAWPSTTGGPSTPVAINSNTVSPTLSLSMTPDGSKFILVELDNFNGNQVSYFYWNGTSTGYTYGGALGSPLSSSLQYGCSFINDATGIAAVSGNDNGIYYLPLTWNGNTATAGSWSKTSTYNATNGRGLCFLGGGYNSKPSWLLFMSYSNSPMRLAPYNSTNNTAGTFVTTYSPNGTSGLGTSSYQAYGMLAFQPCGLNGNILYFIESYTTGNNNSNFNISKVTFTVS
jgi:hypothetical protein